VVPHDEMAASSISAVFIPLRTTEVPRLPNALPISGEVAAESVSRCYS
jgi:hypothetical protein